jgi:hypothetical protein
MKKIDLGQAISLLANLGVIGGLIFLGFELRQNNLLLNVEARAETLRAVIDNESEPYRNHEVAVLLAKNARGEPLDDVERIKMESLATATFLNFYWQWVEVNAGTLPVDGYSLAAWRRIYRGDGPKGDIHLDEAWPNMRQNLNPEFVDFFEQNVIAD